MLSKVRNQFLDFFKSKGHMITPSSSLVPVEDPTLLFINSGMAPMKRYFLNEATPPATRVANSQHCLRVGGKHNDLADVGYTKRHHTFFEMLGNFSFGDYFKQEVIPYAWDFLTNTMQLDPARLYVTTHPKDDEAFKIWAGIVGADRITKLEENVWKMGDVGPFGHCAEIFYDQKVGAGDFTDGDRYLEIWNLVFMSFYSDGKTETELPAKCIDAGMGLERIVSVKEDVNDTYDIAFFKNMLPILGKSENTHDTKIFLDHLRSASFMINEGITPGASGRDYVLRRIIRRGLKSFFTFENLNLKHVAQNILTAWQEEYETKLDIAKIVKTLEAEKAQFGNILETGMKIFEDMFEKNKSKGIKKFDANDLFLLHDTYGFSADIALDLLKHRGWDADITGYEALMEESKEKTRSKSAAVILPFPATEYIDEEVTQNQPTKANIIGFHEDNIILDRTPFYAESGGQVGDIGTIEGHGFKAKIVDTKKVDKVWLHKFEKIAGEPSEGPITCDIDHSRRKEIRAHHSATHLLHQALYNILGEDIKQMGSYVDDKKLRLDFSYNDSISQEKIIEIENMVNEWIRKNHVTKIEEMKFDDAVAKGAKAFFTYDADVRTVKFGNDSFELCGGSHVHATGDIGIFIITKVSSISAGVKRIEAVCSKSGIEKFHQMKKTQNEIMQALNSDEAGILQKINKLQNKNNSSSDIKLETKTVGKLKIGYAVGVNIEIENHIEKNKLDLLCACEENDGKITLKLKIANGENNLDAKEIINELGKLIGAKGAGGRKDFAQTGGKELDKKDKLFEYLCNILSK